MPTAYIEFCGIIENLTPHEVEWWKEAFEEIDEREEEGCVMEWVTSERGARCLVIRQEESQENLRGAVQLVQRFLRQYRPNDYWAIEWANNIDLPQVGAYGGGAYFVTATRIKRISSSDWLWKQVTAFSKAKESSLPE